MNKISILIYEDDTQYREGLSWLLKSEPRFEVLGAFSNADQIVEDMKRFQPQVVLTDLFMPPGISGIEAIRQVRETNSAVLFLVLTALEDDETIFDAIQVGANGYLVKSKATNDLIDSIFMLAAGGAPMSPGVAARILKFVKEKHRKSTLDFEVNLTKREQEILESLTKGNSHKLIAAELKIELLTVRNHLRHIYEKLRVHSATEAISIALRYGLVSKIE
jgi:DNA-binding NarL/FixJ family response regulator